MNRAINVRIFLTVLAVAALVVVFLFQRIDIGAMVGIENTSWRFVANRSIRFLLNDALAIVLIYALFQERKYVVFSIWVQLFGMVLILMPYFIIKFKYPYYNGPLVSFLHRLVLNPTILLLLIPAFYYQRKSNI